MIIKLSLFLVLFLLNLATTSYAGTISYISKNSSYVRVNFSDSDNYEVDDIIYFAGKKSSLMLRGKIIKISSGKAVVKVRSRIKKELKTGMKTIRKPVESNSADESEESEESTFTPFVTSLFAMNWGQFSLITTAEAQYFIEKAEYQNQFSPANNSVAFDLKHDWSSKQQMYHWSFEGFHRIDQEDKHRAHSDLRQAYVLAKGSAADFKIGRDQVEWGVLESTQFVDIINQTDLIEDIDGREKLGQLLASLAWTESYTQLTVYLLPEFRPRVFPTESGRLRPEIVIDPDLTEYESPEKDKHVDWASRLSRSQYGYDLALSYFHGTSRDPNFLPVITGTTSLVLAPFYQQIEQVGLESQLVSGGILIKAEGRYRMEEPINYFAGGTGLEYTWNGVFGTVYDLGFLLEYISDSRHQDALGSFDNDVFYGFRLNFNGTKNIELIATQFVELDTNETSHRLQASGRLFSGLTSTLVYQGFEGSDTKTPWYEIRRDDYLELEISYYL